MPIVRQATPEDIPAMVALQTACYPVLVTVSAWTASHLEAHQRNFPEGQFVAAMAGRIVAHCATFRSTRKEALAPHTFKGITRSGTFDGHVANGEVLYGAEIMVHPEYRRRGLARALYEARFALMRRLGIRWFVAGGRLPGYEKHAGELSADEYVRMVVAGDITDRVLTPQLRSGLVVKGVLAGYLNDPKSRDNAALLMRDLKATAP